MFPLKDSITYYGSIVGTRGMIGLCILVFFGQAALGAEGFLASFSAWGFVPALFFADPLRESWRLVSSMFLHGSAFHLLSNVWFLWVFSPAVEGRTGFWKYLLVYLLSGTGAALLQGLADPSSTVPMVGASGAISGVLGAYLVLFPKAVVLTLVPPFFLFWLPSVFFLGLWFFFQIWYGFSGLPGVAWWAHAGGFLIGMVLAILVRPKRNYKADPFWECWRDYC